MTENYQKQREAMLECQLKARGVTGELVLQAMLRVPRHEFVSTAQRSSAYNDRPLRIACSQTISQPYMVATMIEALGLAGLEKVLEIGTGSGYAAAVLAQIAGQVVTVERHEALADEARERLARLGYDNIEVICADGTMGYDAEAPYEGIVVAAASPQIPQALIEQLAEGGRLVIPLGGERSHQQLVRLTKTGSGTIKEEALGDVVFVPLVGEDGWPT